MLAFASPNQDEQPFDYYDNNRGNRFGGDDLFPARGVPPDYFVPDFGPADFGPQNFGPQNFNPQVQNAPQQQVVNFVPQQQVANFAPVAPVAGPMCFSGDTKVWTDKGRYTKLADLKIGDYVLSASVGILLKDKDF